jgi:hypothetical protein
LILKVYGSENFLPLNPAVLVRLWNRDTTGLPSFIPVDADSGLAHHWAVVFTDATAEAAVALDVYGDAGVCIRQTGSAFHL